MRSDYALYVIAIVCFIVAIYAIATSVTDLYIYTIAVIGIIFLGLGYLARPKVATFPPSPEPQIREAQKQTIQPETKTELVREREPEKTAKRATRTKGRKKKSTTRRKKKT